VKVSTRPHDPAKFRQRLRVTAFALALAATAAVASGPLAAQATQHARQVASIGDQIHQKTLQVDAARKMLSAKKVELRFQEVRKEDLARQLADTNHHISDVAYSLDELNVQVHSNERRLAWNSIQLRAAQATLQRHNDALRRRLVDAYERGELGYVNVLLAANSFNDFVERWDDIRYLVAANQRAVRERKLAERAVAGAEARLESERTQLNTVVREREQERFKLAALADERTQLLGVAEANRRAVSREVSQLENLTAAQESALEALIRERQQEEEARREAERRAARLAGREVPQGPTSGAPGTFSWPVSGPITSPFGMRSDPFGHGFRMHTGIDIGAPMGATITAAAGGRVIYAAWYGGYGNAIIIDHGGQTSTLYGHCSQLFVSNGQDVQRGQAIGAVGSTGESTGPHLHFEVRVNGTPVDPTSRLP
jgi:murein DD-endopeptidase MepM/ murein hydrolase activator NlpD